MFTGIITDVGIAAKMDKNSGRLVVETKYDTSKIALGASVACNGCCLTVVAKSKGLLSFDLSPETIKRTNYKHLKKGDRINLERSMKVGDELGGHIVTGHIDCVAKAIEVKKTKGNRLIKFKIPSGYKKYIAAKGSATINGVSLTVNNIENDIFEVNIIPHTLEQTNLISLKPGSEVNFETDILARYIEKMI